MLCAVFVCATCGHQGTAERQIVHVLVDCAGQEAAYNPFYSNLAVRLCQYHARFKFTFQLTFWDTFKRTSDLSVRRAPLLSLQHRH